MAFGIVVRNLFVKSCHNNGYETRNSCEQRHVSTGGGDELLSVITGGLGLGVKHRQFAEDSQGCVSVFSEAVPDYSREERMIDQCVGSTLARLVLLHVPYVCVCSSVRSTCPSTSCCRLCGELNFCHSFIHSLLPDLAPPFFLSSTTRPPLS